ncbi:hypothetical protein HYDPIDRAFT_109146 [Hydnomerulius pinastri MD-312]|uniref:Uncharacterized protein n=1 Tax=Hydnomerulius pinastri MD-312 TaxID=994086 RepID=A0A0C9W6M4_9AGAM|nr:hypothetical protein HYDPIDRAFT_120260 [Hydnomerulius pinastri MD-312]KIJ67127.1 hypothetical protein HYDPIDRAFT_109146 [Hydnomerulius pinastri MD-312]
MRPHRTATLRDLTCVPWGLEAVRTPLSTQPYKSVVKPRQFQGHPVTHNSHIKWVDAGDDVEQRLPQSPAKPLLLTCDQIPGCGLMWDVKSGLPHHHDVIMVSDRFEEELPIPLRIAQ